MAAEILFKNLFVPFRFAPWPLIAVIFFFSVVIHEVAHGVIASKCGDDTARIMGRITLNPIPHIDPVGTILLPILMFFFSNMIIGWAKPVPINPLNFKNMKADTLKVGISGPVTNFILATLFAVIVWIFSVSGFLRSSSGFQIAAILASGVTVNIILGLFNLVPIPPLDGSRVLSSLLPSEISEKYDRLAPYGFFILIFTISLIWPFIIRIANLLYKFLFLGVKI